MTPDEALQKVLDRQYGLTTRKQAAAVGLSRSAIDHRLRTGRLEVVHRQVLRAPSAPRSLEQSALAACLACEGAAASHRTAAALLGMIDRCRDVVEITTDLRSGRPTGFVVHRSNLEVRDRARIGVIPITSVGRTIVDLAGTAGDRELAEAIDRALRRRSTTADRLRTFIAHERFDRRRKIDIARRIVADRSRFGVPESALEADMIELLRKYGLPEPERQPRTRLTGRAVRFDLVYRDPMLAIELDGQTPHSNFETWQRDHDRHNAVELGGVPTLRFTWWDVHEREIYVIATVAEGLGLRPATWKRRRPN